MSCSRASHPSMAKTVRSYSIRFAASQQSRPASAGLRSMPNWKGFAFAVWRKSRQSDRLRLVPSPRTCTAGCSPNLGQGDCGNPATNTRSLPSPPESLP